MYILYLVTNLIFLDNRIKSLKKAKYSGLWQMKKKAMMKRILKFLEKTK